MSVLVDGILSLETVLLGLVSWPSWALRTIATLCCCIIVISLLQTILFYRSPKDDGKSIDGKSIHGVTDHTMLSFRLFQTQYLTVYLTIMLADWLQGTNMYTLYSSYGVDVGTLFLTGFLSSAVFGTFLGIYVDTWGRKLGCIVFCVLEIVINIMEHIPSMPCLLVGRILGGLSTSLLFTAFESWMVSEHRKRGYPETLLASTFSISSWGNGFVAILAGFLAQLSADVSGDIGPFQLAIALTVVTLVMIIFWPENYGGGNHEDKTDPQNSSMLSSMWKGLELVGKSPVILFLGLSQSFFEGAVFTFVFMWVPSMLFVTDGPLPTGLVFSAFMLAMTIGGMLSGLLLPIFPGEAEGLCIAVFAVAALAMTGPVLFFDFWTVLICFLVLEAMVGMFNSTGATLRSRYYPESMHSSIMSVFRLPLNILVVIGTKLTDKAANPASLQAVFRVLVGMHGLAFLLQVALLLIASRSKNKGKTD